MKHRIFLTTLATAMCASTFAVADGWDTDGWSRSQGEQPQYEAQEAYVQPAEDAPVPSDVPAYDDTFWSSEMSQEDPDLMRAYNMTEEERREEELMAQHRMSLETQGWPELPESHEQHAHTEVEPPPPGGDVEWGGTSRKRWWQGWCNIEMPRGYRRSAM